MERKRGEERRGEVAKREGKIWRFAFSEGETWREKSSFK
jgi:hypothetical protein